MRLSRSISSYEWGIGRSVGFRDSSQDQLGMMHAFPEVGRDMVSKLMAAVHEDGSAAHNSNAFTGHYGYQGFYDDHNWIALATTQYIKETGDLKFANEKMPYCRSKKTGTVIEHLLACQDLAWSLRGKNGLMQTGCADWNDSLNPGDKETESMFTSLLYCHSTREVIDLLLQLGDKKTAAKLERRYKTIKDKMNTIGWDGDWYKRMIKTDGREIGSKKTKNYGKIFVEPQSWAVISGVADKERGMKLLKSSEAKLWGEHGFRVTDYGARKYDPDMGSVGIFPAGIKENGAVFNHCSSWMIVAAALLGEGDRAMEYYKRQSMAEKSRISETHEVEPYVACQFVSQAPFHIVGRGRNGWLTGTASWMAAATMQYIIGVRATYEGLLVAPSIPKKWKKWSLKRTFRGTVYNIEFRNPKNVSSGVSEIKVNGQVIEGDIIPATSSKKEVKVLVTLG